MPRVMSVALLVVLLPLPLAAQDVNCDLAETQMEMTYCAEQEWLAADDALNAAYRAARDAMRAIDAELSVTQRGAEAQLRDAQRAWVTFRDATCAAEGYGYHGGSIEPMVIYGCRARVTTTRAEELRAMTEPNY